MSTQQLQLQLNPHLKPQLASTMYALRMMLLCSILCSVSIATSPEGTMLKAIRIQDDNGVSRISGSGISASSSGSSSSRIQDETASFRQALHQTERQTRQTQQQREEKEEEEDVRLVVRYRGAKGRKRVQQCARKIVLDDDSDDLVVLQGPLSCLQRLQKKQRQKGKNKDGNDDDGDDDQVLEIEEDPKIQLFHAPVESQQHQTVGLRRRTRAQPTAPVATRAATSPPPTTDAEVDKRSLESAFMNIPTWNLEMIQADQLWVGDKANITICTVDTGIAIGHPDFDPSHNNMNITGTNQTRWGNQVWQWNRDILGHGTHVAGTIAAISNIGTVNSFRLHVTRAVDDYGYGYESDVRRAVQQCVDAGSKIINLSLGTTFRSQISQDFYQRLVEDQDILLLAAAGNNGGRGGSQLPNYPASYPSVISVGGVYQWESVWSQSHAGPQVELAGPAFEVFSTDISTASIDTDFEPESNSRSSDEDEDGERIAIPHPAVHIQGTPKAPTNNGIIEDRVFNCLSGSSDTCREIERYNRDLEDGIGGICMMTKDSSSSFEDMILSCQNSGGVGAIIFPANGGKNFRSWRVPVRPPEDPKHIKIPAIAIAKDFGLEMLYDQVANDRTIRMGDVNNDNIEYTYGIDTGTSMAVPHIAGAAGVLWSHFPQCSNHQIRFALAVSAQHPEYIDNLSEVLQAQQEQQQGDQTRHVRRRRAKKSSSEEDDKEEEDSNYHTDVRHVLLPSSSSNSLNDGATARSSSDVLYNFVCNHEYGYGIPKIQVGYEWLSNNDCTQWQVPTTPQGGCTTLV